MKRRAFLLSLGASRLVHPQTHSPGQPSHPSYDAPVPGSMLMCAYNESGGGKGRVCNLNLSSMEWLDYASGYLLGYLYSATRKLLFVSYADSALRSARSYLSVIDFTSAATPRVVEYPGPRPRLIGHRVSELFLSVDGRWLYTACTHTHPCQMSPESIPKGVVANDLDCSYWEDFVYTFDVDARRFLPSAAHGFRRSNGETLTLVPAQDTRELNAYHGEGYLERCQIADDGKLVQKASTAIPVLRPTRFISEAFSSCVRGASGHPVYLVEPDRVLLLSGEQPKVFPIDPAQPGDTPRFTTLSGDGKLMFISGARRDPDKDVFVSRIATYRTASFAKVGESEVSPSPAAANWDGSLLYCFTGSCSNCGVAVAKLYVRDSQTLHVVKEYVLGDGTFANILTVP